MAAMKVKMIGWHRRMALMGAVAVLLWGCSGLLHPLMSWTNPRAASFLPPPVESFNIEKDLTTILKQNGITQIEGLRVIGTQLQVTLPGQAERVYFDLSQDKVIEHADRERAVMIARHYTGLKDVPVLAASLVTEFSNQYTYINRYLPVWKISFDDPRGITAYVDTSTDRLGAITDTRKVILQTLFQTFHTGQWLEGLEPLRLAVMALLVGSALSVAIAGLYMLVRMRGSRRGIRKIHRVLANAALFPLLMFPASGLFHLFVQSPLFYDQHVEKHAPVDIATLDYSPRMESNDFRMVVSGNQVWWRSQSGDKIIYLNARNKSAIVSDEDFVREMVAEPVISIAKVTSFSDEYGFAYKRLPVWRVDTGRELLFIEAKTATVSARVSLLNVAETWSFSRLHKWQFLDPLSEKIMGSGPFKAALRDAVMVSFVLLGLAMAVLGLMIRRIKS